MDFGKIISAAAVSTLGVLSLIVVALGVIAFYFFKGSGDKVKLTVWWTALIAGGMFAVAVIRQSEPKEPPAPEPRATDTPRPVETPEPQPSATPSAVVSPVPTPPPTPTPTPSATPSAAAFDPAALTGQWHDADGNFYNIRVEGNVIGIQQWLNGMAVGYGQGTVDGRQLRYGFVSADGNQGSCAATVASMQRITGTCNSARAANAPFTVER